MTNDTRDRFEQDLTTWVREAISRGVRSFPDLLRSLPGVYPTEAYRLVLELADELPVGWNDAEWPSSPAARDGWPLEHPLDFEWRFTPETAARLIRACSASPHYHLALLGAPSLVKAADAQDFEGKISLFDANRALLVRIMESFPAVEVAFADLVWGDSVQVQDADVTIADPPWYPEHTVAFLWSAARMTRLGGYVLLSAPPLGTRPGIREERAMIQDEAASYGLQLYATEPGVLKYQTPPFERNSLAAAGIPAVPHDWRNGDLLRFVVEEKKTTRRPIPPGAPEEWGEVAYNDVRIKFRPTRGDGFRDPTLTAVGPDGMLRSVSRREPARSQADVWTSGNRIFRCEGTDVFQVIVSALARSVEVTTAVAMYVGRRLSGPEEVLVRRAESQVRDLIRRETREVDDHGHKSPRSRALVEIY